MNDLPVPSAAPRRRLPPLELAIAADIQAGLLAPGAWLKQIDLQARYGRSRGDVRRALERLVAQRLVQHVQNAGFRVHSLDAGRSAHLRQLRIILEGSAAELLHGRAGPEDLARLRGLAEAFDRAVAKGSVLDQNDANQAFHVALMRLCPNPELVEIILETRRRMPSAPLYQWHSRQWVEESARQHHAMLDALAGPDAAAFAALVRAHIRAPA